jgi:lysophospholipase L1-like esterase
MKLMRNEWLRVACGQLRQNLIVVVLVVVGLLGMALAKVGHAQAMSTTTVQGTLYMANGQTGSGTLQVSWPSFTTASGQAVVAGNTTVAVGSDGFVSLNLTPNVGATPAGLYYTAVFYLSNGTTTTQYWVVPAAAQATLAQVQSQVMPAAQAVQAVSKAYVDQAIAEAGQSQLSASGETMAGPLYLNADPTQAMQAADKHYVDVSVSQSSTQPGTAGQIAYYSGTGTAIAGMNAVPVAAGGTGAGNASSALQNLGGISATTTAQQAMAGGLSVAGPLAAQAVTASVNSQLNVMAPPYNAKGDCVTDDSVAIQNALNVQKTSTAQITVYFPAPPGGCYLTSTLTFTGASMQGQAGAGFVGNTGAGVILRGKPSQDVLHVPDPTTPGSIGMRAGWSIRDIVLDVDASVDASSSFPHRWPGKWDQTCGMTASSAALTCANMAFSCADIDQNILVKGAGASGADLSTTVANVTPCWKTSGLLPTVTLTAAASTTVTNAYVYLTPAGIALTQHIGNCALAMDNYDGNTGDWVIAGSASNWAPSLWNVTYGSVGSVGGNFNNTCGIYWGAAWNPYLLDARNLTFWNLTFGNVEGMPDTNPASSSGIGQDYQKWDHGIMLAVYPWISINDGELTWVDYQLRANNGPQILKYNANNEPQPTGWYIHNPEFESNGFGIGYRIEGGSGAGAAAFIVDGTELGSGKQTYLMTSNAKYRNSNAGAIILGGSNNWIDNFGNGIAPTNLGMDNILDSSFRGTSSGMITTTEQTETLNRGRESFGTLTPDFAFAGTAPYYNNHDLFIWPQDFTDIYGYHFSVVADVSSWTGNYVAVPSGGYDINYFNNMYMLGRAISSCGLNGNCNQIYVGQNIPAGPVVVEFSYKCPVLTSFTAKINAQGTGFTTVGGPITASCSTSYQTATILADFSSYPGQAFDLSILAGEVDIAWMTIKPYGALTMTSATIPGATSGSYVKADGTGYGIPSSGVTQISAGTNVTISPSGGTGNVTINSTAGSTLAPYGTIYSANTWANLNAFTNVGSSAFAVESAGSGSCPSGTNSCIQFSGGVGGFSNSLDYNYYTQLPIWTIDATYIVPVAGAATTGIGFGIHSVATDGTFYGIDMYMYGNSGAGSGTVYLLGAPSGTSIASSSGAVSFSGGDTLKAHLTMNYGVISGFVYDINSGSIQTVSGTLSVANGSPVPMPNIGRFTIYNHGGSQTLTSLTISSAMSKNTDVACVGDSKTQGYFASSYGGIWCTTLQGLGYRAYPLAGGSDETADILLEMPEILALAPKNVVLMIGGNDVRNSVATPTWEANISNIVSQISAAGISVYVSTYPVENSGVNMTTLNTYITSTFPTRYIDVNNGFPQTGSGVPSTWLYTDSTHPAQAFHTYIGQTIARYLQNAGVGQQFPYFVTP